MDPVVHFEMPYEDGDRLNEFYSKAFGWQIKKMGEELGNYVVATTTETDESGMVQKPGTINGGFFEKTQDVQYPPSIVIAVVDIKAAAQKVEEAGGKVLGGAYKPGEPDDIPGIGLYSSFIDSEGNRVGMLQPAPQMGKPNA
jgi:predicted enzyme related to lactoylglutathione lyase